MPREVAERNQQSERLEALEKLVGVKDEVHASLLPAFFLEVPEVCKLPCNPVREDLGVPHAF